MHGELSAESIGRTAVPYNKTGKHFTCFESKHALLNYAALISFVLVDDSRQPITGHRLAVTCPLL